MSFMSFLLSFFSPPSRSIRCPFCHTEQLLPTEKRSSGKAKGKFKDDAKQRCSQTDCAREFPFQFLRRYDDAPTLFVPMMGWKGAGKSTFLAAVTVMLSRGVQIWNQYNFEPLTDETNRALREARAALKTRTLPEPTPVGVKESYLCHLIGLPRWGSRTWVVRDVPGEHFQEFVIPQAQTSFVQKSETTFLFLDLVGDTIETGAVASQRPAGIAIDELMKCYTNSLGKNGVSFELGHSRRLVVILTKANFIPELPRNLRDYLERDELQPLLLDEGQPRRLNDEEMAAYMERLGRVSEEIRTWLGGSSDGRAFLEHARHHHIDLRFCMISSIPSGVGADKRPQAELDPLRILDPLFWALELNSTAPNGQSNHNTSH